MLAVKLSRPARRDIKEIAANSSEKFGIDAMDRYQHLFSVAIDQLAMNPEKLGVAKADHLKAKDIFRYHVKLSKNEAFPRGKSVRNPRHIIFFRLSGEEENTLEIIRILHEQMDFSQHL